jgi:hypothetical protein
MTMSRILLPCLSVAIGVSSTLIIAAVRTPEDPSIVAAEQRFLKLPPAEARRIQATYDRLNNSPAERAHVESIHLAVVDDAELELQLERVYDWWLNCDEKQRQSLRALTATPHRWVEEVKRQFADSNEDSIAISIPDGFGRGRRRQLQVSLREIDRFLEDALLSGEVAASDLKWLESVLPEDLRLARVVVITNSLFGGGGRLARTRQNHEAVSHVIDAANDHILGGNLIRGDQDPRQMALACLAVLRGIKVRFSPEFLERLEISASDLEQQFAEMNMSDRIGYMLSDPREAVRLMNARLKASERDTPAAELAQRLITLDRIENRIRSLIRGGRRGELDGREADRRRRRPPP